MKPLELHPFQIANVETILALPEPRKLWVLDETGLGKSVTAITAARELKAERMLVVTKGMVRPGWLERFGEWWPDRAGDVGSITMGPGRAGLSKPAQARMASAYAAPIQVVSYDLMPHVAKSGWDVIVLDEIHEIVSYRSATSASIRDLFAASPAATRLGLTATLLSAEPKNAWNLLHTYWPADWGKPRRTGDPPYWFCNVFCERIENEWGVDWAGLNPANSDAFAKALRQVSVRTLRADVRHLLPPIECSPLIVEAGNRKTDAQIAVEWCDTASRESSHVSIFTYFRESAGHLALELRDLPRYKNAHIELVHGASTPEQRHRALARLREAPRGILLGTMDALGTGISLTAFKQYLITEVTTTANKLVQAIGRFSRLDSTDACRGWVLLREGRDDDKIATLKRRLRDFDTLIKSGQGESVLFKLLESQMEGDAFDRKLDDLIANFRGADAIDDDEEDET